MSTLAFRTRARRRGGRTRPAWRQPLAVAGGVIAVAWLVVAIFAPFIAPYDPLAQTFVAAQSPSSAHLFGTDELGRDVLSRVIYGSRVSVPIALLLVSLAALIGVYYGTHQWWFSLPLWWDLAFLAFRFAYFAVSVRMYAANCSAVPLTASTPSCANFSLTSGSCMTFTKSE